jgi:hypothetical protein
LSVNVTDFFAVAGEFFFLRRHCPLNAPRVDAYAEMFLDSSRQQNRTIRFFALTCFIYKKHYFLRELVPVFRTALAGQKAAEAFVLKSVPRLIESDAGEAEVRGGYAYRSFVMYNPTQHLVLDLRQIMRIKEIVGTENLIPHGLGVRIETAMPAKNLVLGLPVAGIVHGYLLR